jgi:hypothetical protein
MRTSTDLAAIYERITNWRGGTGYDYLNSDGVFGQCWDDGPDKGRQEPTGSDYVVLRWNGKHPPRGTRWDEVISALMAKYFPKEKSK